MALLVFLGFCHATAVTSSLRQDLQTLGLSSASLNLSILEAQKYSELQKKLEHGAQEMDVK